MNSTSPPLIRLPWIRLISVVGPESTSFLQAQLSRRVDNLSQGQSALAGWHDASGKVRAVFRVIPAHDGYLLSVPASLADQLTAALRMFVLRADVTVELTDLMCAGLVTGATNVADTSAGSLIPPLPETLNTVTQRDDVSAICVAPGCWHVIAPDGALSVATEADNCVAAAAEIRAGLPQVDQETTQRYVAQMLNLDKLDAIDFEKGCYPGQEIIARAEHLGSVKRRAQLFSVKAADAPNNDLVSGAPLVNSSDERIGEVLRCARDADGSMVLLGVVALTALSEALFAEHAQGPALTHHKLPFLADQ